MGIGERRTLLLICSFVLALLVLGMTPATISADGGEFPPHILPQPWRKLQPATCMPDRCFCERIRLGVIRQPINTWSNLGFIFAGVMALAAAVHDFALTRHPYPANPMRAHWLYPIIYGAAAILIGIGSMVYHSSLVFFGQVVDVIAMYLLTSFMVFYNVSRLRRVKGGAFLLIYVLANVALGYASIRWPVLRRYIFVVLLLAVLVSEIAVRRKGRSRGNVSYFAGALAGLILACVSWILDITRMICLPDSWLQVHALWHVFMAVAICFTFFYYRSEICLGEEGQ
jgi:hypothetical protein